jgi:hypothetical protein
MSTETNTNLTLRLNQDRAGATFLVARNGAWMLALGTASGVTVYGALGAHIDASVRHRATDAPTQTTANNGATRISLSDGLAALGFLQSQSGGTYDVAKVSIAGSMEMAAKYPLVLTENQRNLLNDIAVQYDVSVRGSTTIAAVVDKSNSFLAQVEKAGGADKLAPALAAQQAQQAGRPVTPQMIAALIPAVKATIVQREQMATRVVAEFSSLPDPEKLRDIHKQATMVERYDPAVSAALCAAGAASVRLSEAGPHLVAGGSLAHGVVLGKQGVSVAREGTVVNKKLETTGFTTAQAFIGAGTTPGAAMPSEAAQKFGLTNNGVGAYFVGTQTEQSTPFGTIKQSACAAMVGVRHQLSNGRQVSGDFGVEAPCTKGGKPQSKATLGVTF